MELIDALVIRTAVDTRLEAAQRENARMQLISAHVAQGYDIHTATRIVDDYIRTQMPQQQGWTLTGLFGLLVIAGFILCFVVGLFVS